MVRIWATGVLIAALSSQAAPTRPRPLACYDFVGITCSRGDERRGVENRLCNEFKIGGEASATAGPAGREASASTEIQIRSEILSCSRSRGLFAGATLNGSSVAEDRDANTRFYGQPLTSNDVVSGNASGSNAAAATLRDALLRNVPVRKAS